MRLGVVLDVQALALDQILDLALHVFERVVDHLRERLVHLVFDRPLVGDQLVAGRNGDIDADAERIAGLLGMIRLLDDDVATRDVVAELVQMPGFRAHQRIGFFALGDATIGNFHR
jgi:hypothetical protein